MSTCRLRVRGHTPGATVVNLSLLPVANRQLPDYPAYSALAVGAMAAGTTFADPVTARPTTKLTSASYPAANTSMVNSYSSGGLQAAGPWGASQIGYTFYAFASNTGAGFLMDYNRLTRVPSNNRSTPWGSDLRFTFSENPSTPRIAYYMNGSSHLIRFDTTAGVMAEAPNATFPAGGKDFTASIASQQLVYLQCDVNDRWFVFMSGAGDAVYAWDSQTNTFLSCTNARCAAIRAAFAIDELHFDKDGRYVYVKGANYITYGAGLTGNHFLWDLQTGFLSDLIAGWSHSDGLRSIAAGIDPNSSIGPNQYYIPAPVTSEGHVSPGSLVTFATDSQLGGNSGHRAGQWTDQGALGTSSEVLISVDSPGNNRSTDLLNLTWVVDAGSVYRTTVGYAYQQIASGGIGDVLELNSAGTSVTARLPKAASRGAMVQGSWFITGTTLYVWRNDNASPDITTHRVVAQVPAVIHDGLGFAKLDGADMRLLGHHYSFNPPDDYYSEPHHTITRDGRLVFGASNMNLSGGRKDVFVYEVPVS